jgi:hypothetical protein
MPRGEQHDHRLGPTLGAALGLALRAVLDEHGIAPGEQGARDGIVGLGVVDHGRDRQRHRERRIGDVAGRVELAPDAGLGGPLERARPLEIDRALRCPGTAGSWRLVRASARSRTG